LKTITAPGSRNLITDVSGVQVGHAEDYKIGTGVTDNRCFRSTSRSRRRL